MTINVQVEKNSAENSLSLLRRFTKRVQGAGILNRVRSIRYSERNQSFFKRKKSALVRLSRKNEREQGIRLGKIKPTEYGRKS